MKSLPAFVLLLAATACGNRATGSDPDAPGEAPQPIELQRAPSAQPLGTSAPATPDVSIEHPPADTTDVAAGTPQISGDTPSNENTHAGSEHRGLRQAWLAEAPSRYVVRECGDGFAPPACSVAAVDSGHVVARTNRFLPTDPWAPSTTDTSTSAAEEEPIAALFTQLETPIDGCKTSYELNHVYAYPSRVYFDCGEEGWGTRVTCFAPDTLDLQLCQ